MVTLPILFNNSREPSWGSSNSINRFLRGSLDYIPGRRVSSIRDFDQELNALENDAQGRGQLADSLQIKSRELLIDMSKASNLGTQILDLSRNTEFKGIDKYVDAMLRHAEMKILPTLANPNIHRPTLIIDRSYYEDQRLRNIDLLSFAQFVAKRFGFTDIYLPDLTVEHSDDLSSIRAFGGYRVASFLDLNPRMHNHKDILSQFLDLHNQHSGILKRILDYGKTQLFHNDTDTFAVIKLPSFDELENLGINFRSETEYQNFKEELFKLFESIKVGESSLILVEDFSNAIQNLGKKSNARFDNMDIGKHTLLKSLDLDTPEHIVSLLYNQDWFFDEKSSDLILMPKVENSIEDRNHHYDANDVYKLARFFTNKSEIKVRTFEHNDLENPAISAFYFSNKAS
jgi:hypothetical protein